MSIWLVAGSIIGTLHLEGPVTVEGGDYLLVPFEVPAETVEFEVVHSDGSDTAILDWGVWSPEGFRGWGGGLTDAAVIGVDESSRGYLRGPITPGTWTLVIGKAELDDGGNTYVVDLTFRDAATLTPEASAPFDPVVLESGARWYAGDLHVHSEESGDASATLEEIATLARERGLDFVVITDHNTVSHHDRLAAAQPALDDLLLIRGIEVTTYAGHGNALGVDGYVDHRAGLDGVGAETIAAEVDAQGGLFSINHPALDLGDQCIGCAWDHADTPWELISAIEIQTGPFALTGILFTPLAIALWDQQLDDDLRIAAVGGSDDHRAGGGGGNESPIGSPTTLVFTDELSEEGILRGIREGRTVVKLRDPDDAMVELTAGGEPIGGEVTLGSAALSARVTGGDGVSLQLWRDGVQLDSMLVDGDDVTLDVEYPDSGRYRAELVDGNGRITVTGHLWITVDPALSDDDGCGCQGGGQRGGLLLAALIGVVLGLRRHAPAQEGRRGRQV
jgi:hypothetical protein